MSIIIETPQAPIRERLVLVREGEPMAPRRDATPEDLERAGWVRDSDLLALTVRAEAAEGERDEARRQIEEARCVLGVEYPAEPAVMAARRVVRERNEARQERDNYRGNYAQRSVTRVMPAERKGIAAVAARVRREQCLVTRAVEAGCDVAIVEAHDDAERPGLWYIVRITESGGEETEATVPAADVPATVERLLGEVTRG